MKRFEAGIVLVAIAAGAGVVEEFPGAATDRERPLSTEGLLQDVGTDRRTIVAKPCRQQTKTVFRGVVRQLRADDGSDRCHHIREAGELRTGRARCHLFGPPDEERDAVPAFPAITFDSAPRPSAVVTMIRAHVNDARGLRAVVAGEDDNRVFGDAKLFQRRQQLADHMIELMDEVTMRAGLGFSLELRRGERRQMHGLRGVKQEERPARRLANVLLQELATLLEKDEVHFLHGKIRRNQPNAAIVRVGMLRQLGRVNEVGRRHGDSVVLNEGIEPIGRRTARGPEERLKAMIDRPACDALREIDATNRLDSIAAHRLPILVEERHPDMPLADARRGIAIVAEHARQREPTGSDQRRSADSGKDRAAIRHAKRHLPRHQAIPCRRADRARTVRVGESHSLPREPVDMRSQNFRLVVVATHIPVSEIVGEDEHDVWLRDRGLLIGARETTAEHGEHELKSEAKGGQSFHVSFHAQVVVYGRSVSEFQSIVVVRSANQVGHTAFSNGRQLDSASAGFAEIAAAFDAPHCTRIRRG